MNLECVGVVGAGQMGTGIAQACLKAGLQVLMVDSQAPVLEQSLEKTRRFFGKAVQKAEISQAQADQILGKLGMGSSLAGLDKAGIVIEAAPENLELKLSIFSELDQACPAETILASNTSSIPIAKLAGATRRPGKVIGMHFMNPVPVMKLVEVISAEGSSQDTLQSVLALCQRLGKTACQSRDAPGFIANRVLMPMINEAILVLEQGIASRESIDTVMKLGANHPMGPLELADFIGLDTCLAILEVLQRELKSDKYKPASLLLDMVRQGKLGRKSHQGFYDYEGKK